MTDIVLQRFGISKPNLLQTSVVDLRTMRRTIHTARRRPIWQQDRLSIVAGWAIRCAKWAVGFNGAVWSPFRGATRIFLITVSAFAMGFLVLSSAFVKANPTLLQISPLDVVKVIGAFASAVFGLYGIGAET